mmetsp:Transcript_43886/g.123991  ORF Transcript_43886/g.123991 Transcript_43886/m.123991 type:complete len:96 (-) Transcript_43886:19-306(-)
MACALFLSSCASCFSRDLRSLSFAKLSLLAVVAAFKRSALRAGWASADLGVENSGDDVNAHTSVEEARRGAKIKERRRTMLRQVEAIAQRQEIMT